MNNHYSKFKYKGKKTLELQITQTRHSKSVAGGRTDEVGPLLDVCIAKATHVKFRMDICRLYATG